MPQMPLSNQQYTNLANKAAVVPKQNLLDKEASADAGAKAPITNYNAPPPPPINEPEAMGNFTSNLQEL